MTWNEGHPCGAPSTGAAACRSTLPHRCVRLAHHPHPILPYPPHLILTTPAPPLALHPSLIWALLTQAPQPPPPKPSSKPTSSAPIKPAPYTHTPSSTHTLPTTPARSRCTSKGAHTPSRIPTWPFRRASREPVAGVGTIINRGPAI